MKQILKQFTPLLIVFTILLSSTFVDAGSWLAPSGTPSPGNNAPKPINNSTSNQKKKGNFTALNVKAGSKMWSPEYCDEHGKHCIGLTAQCTEGQVLVADATGDWVCGDVGNTTNNSWSTFTFTESAIKKFALADYTSDIPTGYPSDAGGYYLSGFYAEDATAERLCDIYAGGDPNNSKQITYTVRSYTSPLDNYSDYYEAGIWKTRPAAETEIACIAKRGGGCEDTLVISESKNYYNTLISSLTCSVKN